MVSAMPAGALTPNDAGTDGERELASAGQLMFSTFLGASGQEQGISIVCDSSGNAYVTGYTYSNAFPTTSGAYDTSHNGDMDVFVSKVSADGSELLWSTFIGGSGDDEGFSITIDSNGDLVVVCLTYSSDFPTTAGCYDGSANGGGDVAIVKLDASGSSLEYSSYFGGSGNEVGMGMLGTSGEVIICGYTGSSDLPTSSGAYDTSFNGGGQDIFAAKFKADCKSLVFSTYVGGTGSDQSWNAPAVDAAGNVYVAGMSSSSDFPVSATCYQDTRSGGEDDVAIRLDPNGTKLQASTYLGGSALDHGRGIAVNPDGDVVVVGYSASTDFPTTGGAFDTSSNGYWDMTASVLDADLSTLRASTYVGGSGEDSCTNLHIDGSGFIYMTGFTESSDFPIVGDCYDDTHNGNRDALLMRLDADCADVINSTFLGGNGLDEGAILDLGIDGSTYLTGRVESSDFPVTSGSYDTSLPGGRDAYVLRYDFQSEPGPTNLTDRDDDGVPNDEDEFPDNPYEYIDTDDDGMGDNLDPDADGDGVPDERDAFPVDNAEWLDTDHDGQGDTADPDDDDDGVPDADDAFPRNPTEFMDSDGDGLGENLDPDDDNDGTTDDQETLDAIRAELATLAGAITMLQREVLDDLAGVNASMGATLSTMRGDILADIGGVNASLAGDIRSLMASVDAGMADLGISVSGEIDDLGGWLDAVMAGTAARLEALSGNLSALAAQSKLDADQIDATLEDLSKLDGIIANVSQLDSDLEQAQRELGADIQDTHEEQMGRSSVNMALIVVVLALALLVLLLLFQMRRVAKGAASG